MFAVYYKYHTIHICNLLQAPGSKPRTAARTDTRQSKGKRWQERAAGLRGARRTACRSFLVPMARPRKSPRGASAPRDASAASASPVAADEAPRAAANVCGNPFCGAALASRVAKFCEDRPTCQRYRAVFLHCAFRRVLVRAGQVEGESEGEAARAQAAGDAGFSIPRRKRKKSDADSAAQGSGKKKRKDKKKSREAAGTATPAAARSRSPSVGQDAVPTEMRVRRRHIQRHVEAAATADGQHEGAESTAAAAVAAGEAARPAGGRAATAAQAVKQMNIELVPLGASKQPVSFAGGGRYVQSGNRTAGPTLSSPPGVPTRPPQPPPPPPPPSVPRAPLPPKAPYNPLSAAEGAPMGRPLGSTPSFFTPAPSPAARQALRASSSSISNGTFSSGSASRIQPTFSNSSLSSATAAFNRATDNGSSKPSTTRISAADYLSARKVQDAAGVPPGPSPEKSFVPPVHPPSLERRQDSRDSYRSDSPDFSFSDWEQPTAREFAPPAAGSSAAAAAQTDHRRESSERAPLLRSASHSDDRSWHPPPSADRPDYRRSHSDTTTQHSSSHRDDRYVQPSTGDAYHKLGGYPEDRRRDSTSYRPVDDQTHEEEYARINRDVDPRSPRRDGYDSGYQRDRPLPRESSSGSRQHLDAFGREIRYEERDHPVVPTALSVSSGPSAGSSAKSSPFEIESPKFSYHDKFVGDLVSVMICEIPHAIGAVKNETKKARKMKWYLDYVDRAAKLFGPDVSIEIKNHKAVMLVKQCEWIVMEDSSTISLYTRLLHRLLGEALMWRHMREEAETRTAKAKRDFGSGANLGISFIQEWNALKTHNSLEFVPLEKQVRYFCGARKHHWSFAVGNVEIGSGSHEDKRTAFNFATTASMKFLLGLRKPESEKQRWGNSSRNRERTEVSSDRIDRGDDRDRRHGNHSVGSDHIRSETQTNVGSGTNGSLAVVHATEPSSANGPRTSPAVVLTEDKIPSTDSGLQGSSGAGSTHLATAQVPSQAETSNSTSGNRVEPAVVTDTDASDVPVRPVDPRLRRPPSDPRLRRPPLTNLRTVGPVSNPRTQGPAANFPFGTASKSTTKGQTTDLRTRSSLSDPRRLPATVSVAPVPIGVDPVIARPIDLSDDDMSISDENDHGACFCRPVHFGTSNMVMRRVGVLAHVLTRLVLWC